MRDTFNSLNSGTRLILMVHHIVSLILDSNKRTSGTNENFSTTITPPIRYITKTILTGFSIPVSFYNININNNKLVYTDDLGEHTITITPGNYTGETLSNAIELAMIAIAPGHVVTFDIDTFKFTFTYTGAILTLTSNTDNANSIMFPLLGFSATQSGALTYTSDNVANIAVPRHINIKSKVLTNNKLVANLQNGTPDEILYVLFPTVDFGCTMVDQNTLHEIDYIRSFQIDSIDLRLEDENDNLIDLNGVNWCISFDFQVQ